MNEETASASMPKSFWWISGALLLWNIAGIASYVSAVTMSPEALAAMDPAEREIFANTPAWATAAYAIAVNGGTLACVFLLMRKAWAVPVFIVSLIAVVVQFFHVFVLTDLLQIRGATSTIFPLVITLIGVYEVWYAVNAKKKGWIS